MKTAHSIFQLLFSSFFSFFFFTFPFQFITKKNWKCVEFNFSNRATKYVMFLKTCGCVSWANTFGRWLPPVWKEKNNITLRNNHKIVKAKRGTPNFFFFFPILPDTERQRHSVRQKPWDGKDYVSFTVPYKFNTTQQTNLFSKNIGLQVRAHMRKIP